ncbi:MAG TPA: hypothetical protein VHP33_29030, partial [Polyangiaceae bacterium]|nr:hypothetical protein [Polyangiaceae bacterium]
MDGGEGAAAGEGGQPSSDAGQHASGGSPDKTAGAAGLAGTPGGASGGTATLGGGGEGGSVGTETYILTEKAQSQVQLGATTVMPFNHLGGTYALLYSPAAGLASLYPVKPKLAGLELASSYDRWALGFTSFAPFYLDGADYFVAFNPTINQVHFDRFPADPQRVEVLKVATPTKQFSQITSYAIGGAPYLLYYDIASGAAVVHTPAPGGEGAVEVFTAALRGGFTQIASIVRSTDTHLLLLDADRRTAQYWQAYDDHLESVATASFSEPLALSAAFADEDTPFLLIYGRDGGSAIYEFSADTFEPSLAWRGFLPVGATEIAPCEQGGKHGFILGDNAGGRLWFYEVARV